MSLNGELVFVCFILFVFNLGKDVPSLKVQVTSSFQANETAHNAFVTSYFLTRNEPALTVVSVPVTWDMVTGLLKVGYNS